MELRELESMLKAAYLSKAHQTQIAERAALNTQERAMDIAAAEVCMQQVRREEEAEFQKQYALYLRQRKYQLEVKHQMEVSLHVLTVFQSCCTGYWYWYWYLHAKYWYWYWYLLVEYLIQDCKSVLVSCYTNILLYDVSEDSV